MKITKRTFSVVVGLVLVMTLCTLQLAISHASAADSSYALPYNGDGGDVCTTGRLKEDATSFYVFPKGDVTSRVNLIDQFGRNCSYKPYFYMDQLWNPYFLYNDAFEHNGYNPIYVKLQLTPSVHTRTTLWGAWSPDSV